MTDQDITQISLGKFKVGITGLKEAIEAVRALTGRSEAGISQARLEKLKPQNYIPAPALVINDAVKAVGQASTKEMLKQWLRDMGPKKS